MKDSYRDLNYNKRGREFISVEIEIEWCYKNRLCVAVNFKLNKRECRIYTSLFLLLIDSKPFDKLS